MKVYIYPADRFGCGALRAIWVGQALALQGHDAVVVPPDAAGTRTALGMISQGNGLEGKVDASGRTVAVSAPDDADVIVLQRVTHAGLAGAIPIWRRCGIAVVVDIDDDLSAIHPSNPAWAGLHPKTGKKGFSWLTAEQACADATLVTVSTPALLARYAPHGRGIVVPNTVPAEYFSIGERAQAMRSGPPVVGWGGSVGSHPDDLQAVGGAIERHVADGGRFTVVGPQEGVARALGLGESGWKATGGVSLAEWPATLARELSVGLAPLADTRFNAAKSWLKPLEYAALGIPSVVSPRAEYRRLRDQHGIGVIASKPKDWIKAIRKLTTDDAWRRDVAEIGRFGASQLILENNAWRWWEAWAAAMEWQKKLNPTPASRIPIKA